MENILEGLNDAQRAAVEDYQGPSLIVAGAGSGKTRVLTSRIAHMISEGNENGTVKPSSILALTFTNKAAAEMRDRIEGLIPPMTQRQARCIWMGTFHSIFLRILRAEADRIGYPTAFTIYDTTDSVSLVKSICREMGLGSADKDNDKYKPRAVFAKISRLKNDLITPAVYEQDPVFVTDDRKRGTPQFLEIYKRYTARCKANGAMDFDDLLVNMVVLLKNNPDVLAKYQDKFRYILVDEYQDTNHVQYLIVKALAHAHGNICVVGDDSQSIYSFRGARIENILNFKRDFPEAKVYKLEQNYRSTQTIVNAANSVIARNASSRDLKKECFSAGEKGEKIKLLNAYTDREEAEMVATEIRSLGRSGVPWEDIAVLYRINALSRSIEEALRRREVPYKIYRGHSFFDRKEIKDLLAYFRLIVNPHDDEAFKRIINYPVRGIGEKTVVKIATTAREKGLSMWEAVEEMASCATSAEEKTLAKKTAAFAELIHYLALELTERSLYDFGREVATRTGIIGGFKAEGTAEAISALENIEELLNSMVGRSETDPAVRDDVEETVDDSGEAVALTLDGWLQSVALMTDMDADEPENRNKVTLMTVHSAKGLEFRYVFIMGLEEELFPSVRDGDSAEIEEERRLFYVALTRAKERSCLSLAGQRFVHGNMAFRRPSRFVREIGDEFLEGPLEDAKPAFGGYGSSVGQGSQGRFGQSGKPMWEPRKPEREVRQPGWETRRQERVAPVVPDGRFRKIAATPSVSAGTSGNLENPGRPVSEGSTLAPGIRVYHGKFGKGTIEQVESATGGTSATDLKVTVVFDDTAHGRKVLLTKFARLEIL